MLWASSWNGQRRTRRWEIRGKCTTGRCNAVKRNDPSILLKKRSARQGYAWLSLVTGPSAQIVWGNKCVSEGGWQVWGKGVGYRDTPTSKIDARVIWSLIKSPRIKNLKKPRNSRHNQQREIFSFKVLAIISIQPITHSVPQHRRDENKCSDRRLQALFGNYDKHIHRPTDRPTDGQTG